MSAVNSPIFEQTISNREKTQSYLEKFLSQIVNGDTTRKELIKAWEMYVDYYKSRYQTQPARSMAPVVQMDNLIIALLRREDENVLYPFDSNYNLAILEFCTDTTHKESISEISVLNKLSPGDDFEAGRAYCVEMLRIVGVI
ncbi:hypothetical protein M0R04_02690 [Candidatus Dojkabacteria bacterium]|jgi:hypothetical protein|nr:hypothetical protein [Candidatus Dojkabacteria bacterium]